MIGPCVFPAFTALGAFFGLGDRDLRVISGVLRFSGEPSALPLLVRIPASYPVVGGVCGLIKRSNVCGQQVSISTYIKGTQDTNWLCEIVSVVLRGLIYRRVAIFVLEKIRYLFTSMHLVLQLGMCSLFQVRLWGWAPVLLSAEAHASPSLRHGVGRRPSHSLHRSISAAMEAAQRPLRWSSLAVFQSLRGRNFLCLLNGWLSWTARSSFMKGTELALLQEG
jgi:hypothetical protein